MMDEIEFDVNDRYLMGFMGTGKSDSFLTQLGPIMSKKIVARSVSDIKVEEVTN